MTKQDRMLLEMRIDLAAKHGVGPHKLVPDDQSCLSSPEAHVNEKGPHFLEPRNWPNWVWCCS